MFDSIFQSINHDVLMKSFLKLTSYLLCISLCFYTGCASNDEPEPFDCSTSDLDLNVSASTDPTSCLAEDGSITVLATGGEEPYQYQIGTGAFVSANVFIGLGAGVFIITVKDKNGCTSEATETLVLPGANPLAATFDTTEDNECLSNNGTITINATGGTPPYEYKLGSGGFVLTSLFENVGNGNQTVIVRDADGCTITLGVNVPRGNTGTTYVDDILPILTAKCQFSGCHPDNGNWFDYNTAKNNAGNIKTRTGNGTMPKSPQPGGALTADQKALIACWVDDGAPQN